MPHLKVNAKLEKFLKKYPKAAEQEVDIASNRVKHYSLPTIPGILNLASMMPII